MNDRTFLGMTFIRRHFRPAGLMALLAWVGAVGCAASSVVSSNTILPGTRFATEYYVVDSGVTGPTVMIVGGAHGNEPAGAVAAENVRQWPIASGKLVVVPRANVPALQANKRNTPNLSTNLSNLNRNYPRAGQQEGARGELAQAIWALALEHKPDWLLDLHEGFDFNQVNEKSVGSSIIVFPEDRGREAADLMLSAVNATIADAELKFVRRNLPINGSLARAGGEHLKIPSMTVETTSKQPLEKRVRQHEIMAHRLLHHLGMTGPEVPTTTPAVLAAVANENTIRVAIYQGPGTGGQGPISLLKRLNNPPLTTIAPITPEQIRGGALTNYDIVIFGGGSGSKEAEAIGETGRQAVQEFVANGGGYIGICAGAYLATSGYPWSLGLVNAKTVSPKWRRGRASIKLELTATGQTILGQRAGEFDCLYANGPIVAPDTKPNLPAFETLAYYRTEVSSNGAPVGVMLNSPAIFTGQYQQGRVVCVGPHPEQTPGLQDFVPNAILWAAPKGKQLAGKPAPKGE